MEPIPKQRFLLCHKGDHRIPIEDAAAPILEGGRLIGGVTVFGDVTDRVALEHHQAQARTALQDQMQAATRELGHTHAELRLLSQHLMIAQEEDRRRLARELHDDLAQRAAVIDFDIEALRKLLRGKQSSALLQRLQQNIRDLARGLRETSHRLHPSLLDDLGLPAALRGLVEEHCKRGEDVTYVQHGEVPLISGDATAALYRIAQEAVHNAARHARHAAMRVSLSADEEEVRLTIEDAGPGFVSAEVRGRGGLGLLSMQERASLVGGVLTIDAGPDRGTRVLVRVPLKKKPLSGGGRTVMLGSELERMRGLSVSMLTRREALAATLEQLQTSFAQILTKMQKRGNQSDTAGIDQGAS